MLLESNFLVLIPPCKALSRKNAGNPKVCKCCSEGSSTTEQLKWYEAVTEPRGPFSYIDTQYESIGTQILVYHV